MQSSLLPSDLKFAYCIKNRLAAKTEPLTLSTNDARNQAVADVGEPIHVKHPEQSTVYL